MVQPTVAVVITSYNRCADLRSTCEQLRKLNPLPDEIIICLDGCSDKSSEMLAREFPEYQVIKNSTRQGSIPSRDRAFRLVKSDLILTLDDDSYPTDLAFIEKARQVAARHPEAGVITFPEIRNDGHAANPFLTPDSPGCYVRDFPNCAAVMWRHLYGSKAEYPVFFSHAYAESDYSLQLYAAGYSVWFEPSLTIRHHFTPKERDMLRRHHLNARNELWSVLMRCPFPYVLAVVPLRILRQFVFAIGRGFSWWSREPEWWWNALTGLNQCFARRKPISCRSYFQWIRLARNPAVELSELESRFGISFHHKDVSYLTGS